MDNDSINEIWFNNIIQKNVSFKHPNYYASDCILFI